MQEALRFEIKEGMATGEVIEKAIEFILSISQKCEENYQWDPSFPFYHILFPSISPVEVHLSTKEIMKGIEEKLVQVKKEAEKWLEIANSFVSAAKLLEILKVIYCENDRNALNYIDIKSKCRIFIRFRECSNSNKFSNLENIKEYYKNVKGEIDKKLDELEFYKKLYGMPLRGAVKLIENAKEIKK